MALNALIFVGSLLAGEAVDSVKSHGDDPRTNTYVTIGIGLGDSTAGGNVPHVALWDVHGNRVGQYHPKRKNKIAEGASVDLAVPNDQTTVSSKIVQAEYIMLSMNDNDAICVNYIDVQSDGASWTFLGDTGYICGMDWYPSQLKIGTGTAQPRCVWLDKDHTNGLRFQGLSMHIPDLSGAPGVVKEYNDNINTLCDSEPRFKAHETIWPDDGIRFFIPPLLYNADGSDLNQARVIGATSKRDEVPKRAKRNTTISSNSDPSRLIVSSHVAHSAKEVCESKTSHGPDFVSTQENIYCDMTTKQAWPLCSSKIKVDCFDIDAKDIRHGSLAARDETGKVLYPTKSYNTTDFWDP